MYAFHIQFSDGSNPYYHFPCEQREHCRALRAWKKSYNLTKLNVTEYAPGDQCVWFMAYPKAQEGGKPE